MITENFIIMLKLFFKTKNDLEVFCNDKNITLLMVITTNTILKIK